ncbi:MULTISPECIES: hypothetical protein [unclassified Streptomyces]|uniref:hypothetical protein n=1 Tax=unclassified Streptomyces TaxID=2593676 RepID=UPI002E0E3A77|nr:hypothetical protein OG457_13240 [Streptomyces sp. NBC_01207]WTA18031.1 hypothetical protein OG365_08140 [Streptomyces sp. NBC_00853]
MLTTLRVHDYRSDTLPLLTEGALPLVAGLAADPALDVCFPTRHWDGGPHLALHLGHAAPAADVLARARRRLAAAAGHGRAWTPEEYARRAGALARAEGVAVGHQLPHPHGSVLVSTDTVVPGPVQAVRHRFLTALARELAGLLPADPAAARSRAPGTALRWMAALAASYPGGARFGSLSFRSHTEAFLASRTDGEELRARFAAAAQRYAPQTGQLVDSALYRPEELPGYAACATALAELLDPRLHGDLEEVLGGRVGPAGADPHAAGPDAGGPHAGGPHAGRPDTDSAPSAFHRRLAELGFGERTPPAFQAYRVLVNWLYEALQWLGVTPINRYLYCHCLAHAVDERLGETWQDRLTARPS